VKVGSFGIHPRSNKSVATSARSCSNVRASPRLRRRRAILSTRPWAAASLGPSPPISISAVPARCGSTDNRRPASDSAWVRSASPSRPWCSTSCRCNRARNVASDNGATPGNGTPSGPVNGASTRAAIAAAVNASRCLVPSTRAIALARVTPPRAITARTPPARSGSHALSHTRR